ncbi:LysR family transcriptional regulator [Streptomyces broussonetiae]|uniref:LysR family transcriptional regulator n=1 Tax=Streptomyces broussonetiae TaxID=2686304 RepID=UPI001E4E6DCB|nr:LysR family transcriptional regulator [Streptomyces broussonetiae]
MLSRRIRALEKDMGAELFVRDSRGVALTDADRQLLDGRQLLSLTDAARRRVLRAPRGPRRLVVGFRAGAVVTQALRAFAAAHPDVEGCARRVVGAPPARA